MESWKFFSFFCIQRLPFGRATQRQFNFTIEMSIFVALSVCLSGRLSTSLCIFLVRILNWNSNFVFLSFSFSRSDRSPGDSTRHARVWAAIGATGAIIFGSDQEVREVMRAVRRNNVTGMFSWIGSDGWSARNLVSDGNEPEVSANALE